MDVAGGLVMTIVPALVAVLKMGAEWLERKLPTAILPAITPFLGIALKFLLPLVGIDTEGISVPAAGALGLAGVGVREVAVKGTRTLSSGGTT